MLPALTRHVALQRRMRWAAAVLLAAAVLMVVAARQPVSWLRQVTTTPLFDQPHVTAQPSDGRWFEWRGGTWDLPRRLANPEQVEFVIDEDALAYYDMGLYEQALTSFNNMPGSRLDVSVVGTTTGHTQPQADGQFTVFLDTTCDKDDRAAYVSTHRARPSIPGVEKAVWVTDADIGVCSHLHHRSETFMLLILRHELGHVIGLSHPCHADHRLCRADKDDDGERRAQETLRCVYMNSVATTCQDFDSAVRLAAAELYPTDEWLAQRPDGQAAPHEWQAAVAARDTIGIPAGAVRVALQPHIAGRGEVAGVPLPPVVADAVRRAPRPLRRKFAVFAAEKVAQLPPGPPGESQAKYVAEDIRHMLKQRQQPPARSNWPDSPQMPQTPDPNTTGLPAEVLLQLPPSDRPTSGRRSDVASRQRAQDIAAAIGGGTVKGAG